MLRFRRFFVMATISLNAIAGSAHAAYPDQPVKIIIPFGAGGITDVVARSVGASLSTQLGTAVVIDNRPGAGGVIAAQAAATAKPDGYTLFMGTVGTQVVNPLIRTKLAYDPDTSFSPVGMVSGAPFVLAVRPGLGIDSYADLIAYAKANPGKLNFGSAGTASSPHLALELLKLQNQVIIEHVPFKSGMEAVNAAVGGQVDIIMDAVPVVMPQVQAQRLKALMVGASQPIKGTDSVPSANDVPQGFTLSSWTALYAPSHTPPHVMQRLNDALRKTLSDTSLRSAMADKGVLLYEGTTAEYQQFIKEEQTRWQDVIRHTNIRID